MKFPMKELTKTQHTCLLFMFYKLRIPEVTGTSSLMALSCYAIKLIVENSKEYSILTLGVVILFIQAQNLRRKDISIIYYYLYCTSNISRSVPNLNARNKCLLGMGYTNFFIWYNILSIFTNCFNIDTNIFPNQTSHTLILLHYLVNFYILIYFWENLTFQIFSCSPNTEEVETMRHLRSNSPSPHTYTWPANRAVARALISKEISTWFQKKLVRHNTKIWIFTQPINALTTALAASQDPN